MTPALLYLSKSLLCSGILYTYYRIAFRNKPVHQWNRFFLLSAVVISLVLPLITIDIPVLLPETESGVTQLLNVVVSNSIEPDDQTSAADGTLNLTSLMLGAYALISILLLGSLFIKLNSLWHIYRSSAKQQRDNVRFVFTNEKNTPFSFFNIIFWNSSIDLKSLVGQKILDHEKTHINQLHSLDRLFMNCVLIVLWCNPFFWLINRELIAVHEFIADKKAVKDGDPATLSEMLLTSAFPSQNFHVASAFFNSSIKRRLTMLTTFKNSRALTLGKWMLLPVLLFVFAGFTLRKKHSAHHLKNDFIVMIDAGHGGVRTGATAADGTYEKDLNLALATKIKTLNTDPHLKIVMTREDDKDVDNRARVESSRKIRSDAFLSIHHNNDPSGAALGIQLMMTKKSTVYAEKSQLLGTLLSQELKKVYKVDGELRKGPADRGVWVLDAPEITYPSIMIECGNLQNSEELAFMKSSANQDQLAASILSAVKKFAEAQQ